jgi:hypothetical protein
MFSKIIPLYRDRSYTVGTNESEGFAYTAKFFNIYNRIYNKHRFPVLRGALP